MSNAELSELVKKFQAIQRQDVPNQIGERNVVEIINVLRKKKLVDLLYTVDGKEYLTWDQLRREVVDEILVNGGRMSAVDLPGSLNVHFTFIERLLPEVLADPTIRMESGELITNDYLDSTVRAAAEVLEERGFLSIAEFAKTHQFTSLFAHGLLTGAVGSGRLRAVLEGEAFYTPRFVRAQKVILRAALMAATRPVRLPAVVAAHRLFAPLAGVVAAAVAKELPGRFDGDVYVPAHFEAERAVQVENVYISNGYIEYATLQQQGIAQPREFLLARYNPAPTSRQQTKEPQRRRGRRNQTSTSNNINGSKNNNNNNDDDTASAARSESHPNAGHALSTCFVSDRLLANIVAFEDIVQGDAVALDLAPLLPLAVDLERDMDVLMKRLRELHPIILSCIVLDGGVFIHESAQSLVKERLRSAFAETLKKGGKKGGKKTQSGIVFGEEQEQTFLRVISDVTGLSEEQYNHSLEELSSHWKDFAMEVYEELLAAADQNASVDLKRMRSELQNSLYAAWVDMVVAAKGVSWATTQLDETASVAINRHLLTTRALPMVRDILLNEGLDVPELYDRICDILTVEQKDKQPQLPTITMLQKALRVFPESQRQSLLPIVEAVNGKSVENFASLLQEMCSTGKIAVSSFHPLNKKAEREMFAGLKIALVDRIKSETFTNDVTRSASLFSSLCSLLVQSQFHVYIEIPGKAVASVVARLLKERVSDAAGHLQECLHHITGAISRGELSDESLAILEQLRQESLEGA
ncbi:E3 UFM1-protein ligase 1 [Trypanosoma melophagium]|uniref:E3 UFM1-protein ligase 1 n=1 Tax=Trypanosoma melophagium TaxID=715481 RepID=UPI003519FF9C|nr:E3 UFM1-protein ligase 1 [Trypanosoma melophagium]